MTFRKIEVLPISGNIGALIKNVQLNDLDDETFAEIHQAWLENCVVFFRNQKITPQQQISFAKRFGEIHFHPYMKGLDEHPEILEIIKEPGDGYTFGSVWHTDQMFNPKPAKATMLYAHEVPSKGGDTMFSNQYLAYEALSQAMKEILTDVKTFNVGDGFRRGIGKAKRMDRYAKKPNHASKNTKPRYRAYRGSSPVDPHPSRNQKKSPYILEATPKLCMVLMIRKLTHL